MALLQSRVANLFLVLLVVGTVGCAAKAKLRVADGTGPQPVLPQPDRSLVPRIDVVDAKGWPPDAAPTPAQGLTVTAFARGLDHPRWLYVLPNGDVLIGHRSAQASHLGNLAYLEKRRINFDPVREQIF